jgi:hypothetical protein
VEQAAAQLRIEPLGLCAARAESFGLLEKQGLRGGSAASSPARAPSGTFRAPTGAFRSPSGTFRGQG